jgi:hypothetical protein
VLQHGRVTQGPSKTQAWIFATTGELEIGRTEPYCSQAVANTAFALQLLLVDSLSLTERSAWDQCLQSTCSMCGPSIQEDYGSIPSPKGSSYGLGSQELRKRVKPCFQRI